MLRRRRAALVNKQSVPYGFEKVEYLESPSSASKNVISAFRIPINGYQPGRNNIKLQSEHSYPAKYTDSGAQSEGCTLDGASFNIGYSNNRKSFYIAYDGTTLHGGNDQYFNWSTDFGNWTTYSYELSPNLLKLIINDNVLFSSEIIFNSNVETKQFYCFGRLSDNIYYNEFGLYGKKKWMKFYCDDKLERDLIPAIDRTRTPCMFDKISRKKFYNAGTGQFGYPHKDGIPNNYTKLEYLESDGNQYIRISDIAFTSEDDIEVSSLLQINNINNVRRSEGQNGVHLFWGIMGDNTLYAGNGTGRWGTTNHMADDNWHIFTNKNTSAYQGFYVDDSLVFSGAKITSNHNPLYLDIWKCYGGSYSFGNRKKWWRVTLNDEVKHNLIPYLDPTGTPCMFDTVSQISFYNSGTGDFLYPSPTSAATYSLRRPRAEYAKMTDTGVRRLYHVPVDYEGSIEEYASENGYKLLNETDSPSEEGKYYNFRWVETDTELTTEWYEVEPPTDELGNPIENIDEPQSSTFNLQRPAPIDTTVYSNKSQWAKMTDTGVRRLYHTPKGYEGTLEEYAIQNGFKHLIETESPNEEGKYYSFKWVETDDTLTTEWFEVEPPREEFIEENLDKSIE